ncbi:Kcnh5 [Symbiodinium sp. CCMP2592]|nr:Kcnh5 [Symbiodinium sp. CCMP2592]
MLLDQMGMYYDLNFGAAVTGNSILQPEKPRAESELDMNIRSAWTTPLSKKGSMVLKQVSAKHTLSATQEEDDDQNRTGMSTTRGRGCLDRLVLHPYKAGRVSWGLLTLIVVAWEAVAMPLLLFDLGDLSVALSSITSAMLAFWIVDICINCITGVDRGGVIDLKLKTAFREYATSWMVPDLLIVALDVVVLVAVSEDSGETPTSAGSQGMRLARALRLLRLIRLLRIYKASSAANFLVDYIRSPSLLIASKIAWTLLTILFINHYIACGWCAIAYFNVDALTWILASNLEQATFTELYLSSLHWSLTQFSPATNNIAPQNVLERSVAAFVVIFALLVFSSFVSSITNHMNQLRITNARMIEEDMQLRNFFEKRMISVDLSGRIQHLFKKGSGLHMRRPHIGDIPFLKEMPESLRIHLHNELYMKHFYDMPVFSKIIPLDRSLFSKICHHAFEERFYPASFEVFVDGSNAKFTIINVNGDLDYSWMQSAWDPQRSARGVSHATTLVKVPLGAWLAEAALWSDWTHRGLLESVSPSEILLLDVSSFTYQCHNHGGPVYNLLRRVAVLAIAYREQLSRSATAVTDLPLHEFAWKNILERAAKLQTMNTVINAMTRASFLK